MKGWVGWILLALSLVLAYQGYENIQLDAATEEMARAVACDAADGGCVLNSERPREIRTDIMRRRYAWSSNKGQLHVVCQRAHIFLGAWSCDARKGGFPDA